jgi:hypothetical protein
MWGWAKEWPPYKMTYLVFVTTHNVIKVMLSLPAFIVLGRIVRNNSGHWSHKLENFVHQDGRLESWTHEINYFFAKNIFIRKWTDGNTKLTKVHKKPQVSFRTCENVGSLTNSVYSYLLRPSPTCFLDKLCRVWENAYLTNYSCKSWNFLLKTAVESSHV